LRRAVAVVLASAAALSGDCAQHNWYVDPSTDAYVSVIRGCSVSVVMGRLMFT
jgi:hypothetical protein